MKESGESREKEAKFTVESRILGSQLPGKAWAAGPGSLEAIPPMNR